ncbi:MAG TPA: hypothetical protein EYP56_18025, partial [Planctomycetaceae bacterium]|nr:hypothetical protein [Planctomycetaceae bacterium]
QLVGCGQPCPGSRVAIVDPETRRPLGDGQVGEIWLAGPHVAHGYWGRAEETEATFGAVTVDGDGPFLRTGDLGFVRDGELFVTGRLKEMIIFCGANHYPQDIEGTVERCHPELKAYGGAAFAVEREGREEVVVVHEVGRPGRVDLENLLETIRRRGADEHQIPVHAVVLIRQGSLPKTSSGKTRRGACRQLYLEGRLPVVAQWQASTEPPGPEDSPSNGRSEPRPYVAPRNPTERLLADAWAEVLGVPKVGIHDDFFDLGGNSLVASRLIARLAPQLDVELPLSSLFERRTVAGLAELIDRARADQAGPCDAAKLADLLDKLEAISDREAQQMLAGIRDLEDPGDEVTA